VVIPRERCQKMMDEQEAGFARLPRILMVGRPVPCPEEEVEADVAEALAAVGRKDAASRFRDLL
jgi:hypothetical protein